MWVFCFVFLNGRMGGLMAPRQRQTWKSQLVGVVMEDLEAEIAFWPGS